MKYATKAIIPKITAALLMKRPVSEFDNFSSIMIAVKSSSEASES